MAILSLKQTVGLELDRRFRHNQKLLHPLRQLFWECTLRCNLHCKHCGSDCKTEALAPDMPAEDFLKVIDEQVTPHVEDRHEVMIIFSGGEPLARKDIEDIADVISWNLWQMDGLKYGIPGHNPTEQLGGGFIDMLYPPAPEERYCRIFDWEKQEEVIYAKLIKQ